jgi:hypothetical protein
LEFLFFIVKKRLNNMARQNTIPFNTMKENNLLFSLKGICKKGVQDFHHTLSKVFYMVKSVALWSANIRKTAQGP